MTWLALIRANWLPALAVLLTVALGGLYMRNGTLEARVETARAEARSADERARVNAETVDHLRRLQADQLAAIARDAEAARERAERAAATVETLRRDPTHSSVAAPVLDRAVARLRERRTAGGSTDPGAAPGLPPATPPPSGAP